MVACGGCFGKSAGFRANGKLRYKDSAVWQHWGAIRTLAVAIRRTHIKIEDC